MYHHLFRIDALTTKIISACFPEYRGRKVRLCTSMPTHIASRWEGGSRCTYAVYNLATGETVRTPADYETDVPSPWPDEALLVEHCICCGKDLGITIYASPSTLCPMLPEPYMLTAAERIVLKYTYGYKAAFRIANARLDTGIVLEDWNAAKGTLIARGMLTSRGAITALGKNQLDAPY